MQYRINQGIHPLRINIIGMEQRARDMLQLFFHNICQDNYVLGEETTADVSIIDMDAVRAEQFREEHKSNYPDRPVILVSLLEPEHEGELFLQKPMQPEELVSTLEQIRETFLQPEQSPEPETASGNELQVDNKESMQVPPVLDVEIPVAVSETKFALAEGDEDADALPKNYSGEIIPLFPNVEQDEHPIQPSRPQAATETPSKEKAAFLYDPENYLQGYIQKAYQLAQRENKNVSMEGPWRPIIIIPETQEIWVEQSHAHLYALSVMLIRAEDVTIRVLDKGQSPPEQGGSIQSIEFFLWKLAVRTARGRIPVGTDLRAPIYLSHWPNLSRLMPIHHGLRIAALWAHQPVSLMETATILNIAPKYIFSFYSAANALGLVKQGAKNSGDEGPPPVSSQQENEHRGLFRKILARLRGRS